MAKAGGKGDLREVAAAASGAQIQWGWAAPAKPKMRFDSEDAGIARLEKTEQKNLKKFLADKDTYRLSFGVDPSKPNRYAGIYRPKRYLIPDNVAKQIAVQDSLVAAIVHMRSANASSFGQPRRNRFSLGYIFEPETGLLNKMSKEEREEFQARVDKVSKWMETCGETDALSPMDFRQPHQQTFSEWLSVTTRTGVINGRIATERVFKEDQTLKYFVALDGGTIYHAPFDAATQAESVRRESYNLLATLIGKTNPQKVPDEDRFHKGEYVYVQAVDGRPIQVFTKRELAYRNLYPVADIEMDGYPITPLDGVLSAVTTHLNITTHNRLYFQAGRAAKGMLVFKSENMSQSDIAEVRAHFNNAVNNVYNSHRMPVFAHGEDEDISWQPIDTGSARDMEFQYLTDMNAREIMTAFMCSPEELPGWQYLSRGSNSQTLSESNNEFVLEAARDVGIRPLLAKLEEFINSEIVPYVDAKLAKEAKFRLVGLDADNAEKEAVRLTQDAQLHLTYDELKEHVEKDPIGPEWCGSLPLNEVIKGYLDAHHTVGEIEEHFLGRKGASEMPELAYRRDEYWFKWQEFQQQAQQLQMQMQAQQQQAAAGGDPSGGGGAPPGGGGGDPSGGDAGGGQGPDPSQRQAGQGETEKQRTAESGSAQGTGAAPSQGADQLARAVDQAFDLLNKSEAQLNPNQRRILVQHQQTLNHVMAGLERDTENAVHEILAVARSHRPRA